MAGTRRILAEFLADERGATAIEYGLILGLMVIAIVASMTAVADANEANYQLIEDSIVT